MSFTRTAIGLIKDENAVSQGEKLRLRFVNTQQSHCKGEVGMKTFFTDRFGKPLHVGDLVEVRDPEGRTIQNFVVVMKNTCDGERLYTHYFAVMGYAHREPVSISLVRDGYQVTLIKPYTELKHGDRHDMIHALMLDESVFPEYNYQRAKPSRHPMKNGYLTRIDNKSEHYGKIGKSTLFTDCFGRHLSVGDVVDVYDENNKKIFCGFLGQVQIWEKTPKGKLQNKYVILGLNESDARIEVFNCREQRLELNKALEDLSPYSTYNNYRVNILETEPEMAQVAQTDAFFEKMHQMFNLA